MKHQEHIPFFSHANRYFRECASRILPWLFVFFFEELSGQSLTFFRLIPRADNAGNMGARTRV
jgi:hypothetical protein